MSSVGSQTAGIGALPLETDPRAAIGVVIRFDVYGLFRLEVRREDDAWVVYRADLGKRCRVDELAIPPDLPADELGNYLDAFYHEYAKPGQRVERLR
jgi:hypothetical protein